MLVEEEGEKIPQIQSLLRYLLTPCLHAQIPVSWWHWRWRDPVTLHSHALQPTSALQSQWLRAHTSHCRPSTFGGHTHWPDANAQILLSAVQLHSVWGNYEEEEQIYFGHNLPKCNDGFLLALTLISRVLGITHRSYCWPRCCILFWAIRRRRSKYLVLKSS